MRRHQVYHYSNKEPRGTYFQCHFDKLTLASFNSLFEGLLLFPKSIHKLGPLVSHTEPRDPSSNHTHTPTPQHKTAITHSTPTPQHKTAITHSTPTQNSNHTQHPNTKKHCFYNTNLCSYQTLLSIQTFNNHYDFQSLYMFIHLFFAKQ